MVCFWCMRVGRMPIARVIKLIRWRMSIAIIIINPESYIGDISNFVLFWYTYQQTSARLIPKTGSSRYLGLNVAPTGKQFRSTYVTALVHNSTIRCRACKPYIRYKHIMYICIIYWIISLNKCLRNFLFICQLPVHSVSQQPTATNDNKNAKI